MIKNRKSFISMFFVALFMLFKVAGLHALSHDEDSDVQHCEVCHITTAVNFTPLLEVETTALPHIEYFYLEQKTINNAFFVAFKSNHLLNYFFTRPPPKKN